MPTQISINNLILFAIRNRLIEKMIDDLDDDPQPVDEAQAGLVIAGKLFDDPTETSINLLVRNGGEDWEHSIAVADQTTFVEEGKYEIGSPYGSADYKRRFIVRLWLFLPAEDTQEDAIIKGNVVLARVENAIMTVPWWTIGADSFGERIHRGFEVNDSWIREGGGPGSFIIRGEVKVSVFTTIDVQDVTA